MKPSEIIKQRVEANAGEIQIGYQSYFEREILNYLDEQYLAEHQRHTNGGLSCEECRKLGL